MNPSSVRNRERLFSIIESGIIVLLALVPLFTTFPYRVNIFLSWEGAYRLSQGQIPYRDFGMPLGYMYWVIPTLFFKIFGPQLITLVKAQVMINIISGFAFRSILKSLDVRPGIRLMSVLLYCISFSFFNFWPWYNHTVIVYEMAGLAFLMRYMMKKASWLRLSLSALFLFFSFFTKQDGGGLAFMLSLVLLAYHCLYEKKWHPLLIFLGSYLVVAFAIISPLTRYNFGYWFNHGQPPHTSRVSVFDIADEFFSNTQWIKFYLLIILLILLATFKSGQAFFARKRSVMFFLLTTGILAEASVLQVTSYTPPDNNIFFHSFAFAYIFSYLGEFLKLDFNRTSMLLAGCFGLLLWWSGSFWKYFQRTVQRLMPAAETASRSGENIVNRKTYIIPPPNGEVPLSEWKFTGLRSFNKIYMPGPTVDGIHRLLSLPLVRSGHLRVLNMTELTPLAVEMPYRLETGPDVPLWYHLGVGMFNSEARTYGQRIAKGEYDLVLFEYIPTLNNFYPFRVRDSLKKYYDQIDSFPAPRRGETQGTIEIFKKH